MKYYAIRCGTQEDADKLLTYLDEAGVRWESHSNLSSPIHGYWANYEDQTCYGRCHEDFGHGERDYLNVGSVELFEDDGYIIIDFHDDKSIIDYIIDPPEKRRFNINDYPGAYVMHCPTEESAEIFCEYLHNIGKKWSGGASFLERHNWRGYKEKTIYYFHSGQYGSVTSLPADFDITVLEFYDFDWGMEVVPYEESDITLDEVLGLEEQI